MNATVLDACLTNNLSAAQESLTLHININGNDHNAYANRSFVHTRKCDWDSALDDALKVTNAPSWPPCHMLTLSSLSAFSPP